MNVPENLFYTKEHEWVKIEGNKGTIGITDHAQHSLGDITFIEMPAKDAAFSQFDKIATVESVKAVSDVYSPMSGKVIEINEKLNSNPELVNQEPYGRGWICVVEIRVPGETKNLMDTESYKEFLKTQE
jgi:glycine cleavage system H protein